jgi:hypothetical protein
MFKLPSLSGCVVVLSSNFAIAAETAEFSVEACTTDNVAFTNTLQVRTIGNREMPDGILEELNSAWQIAILKATAQDVQNVGPIWSPYQQAIGKVSARHGVRILAVNGGAQRQDGFCFQPIGKPI